MAGRSIIIKRIKRATLGIVAGIVMCELVLRIYNPSPATVKNGKLILPANQQRVFNNEWISKLDKKIFYSKNSLGFRGPEIPGDTTGLISILTVGGSTTECKYLSDSCTWPARLYEKLHENDPAIWLNNAGIDGHTTFGHLLLLKEYILKLQPRYILLMTGVNDVELDQPDEFDKMSEKKINTSSAKALLKSLAAHTELGRAVMNYYQLKVSFKKGLVHREISLNKLVDNPVADSVIKNKLVLQEPYLKAYRHRLEQIITSCLNAGITPILITQPSLYGTYTDPVTQVNVSDKWFEKNAAGENCALMEKVLEAYNDVLRSFAGRVPVIDLARLMPKNSSLFYDFVHVTNEGAEQIAGLLLPEINKLIYSTRKNGVPASAR